jgi:hypothetical protein
MNMGEWKVPLSLRVSQLSRDELQAIADHERRSLANLGQIVLEWGFEQLKIAGSTHRLLKFKIRPKASNNRVLMRTSRRENKEPLL